MQAVSTIGANCYSFPGPDRPTRSTLPKRIQTFRLSAFREGKLGAGPQRDRLIPKDAWWPA